MEAALPFLFFSNSVLYIKMSHDAESFQRELEPKYIKFMI